MKKQLQPMWRVLRESFFAVLAMASVTSAYAANPPIGLTATFVTPAGDPVAAPKNAGDGQNEFTFNAANPGVLTINLKANINIQGQLSQALKDKLKFTIDGIGNSQMQWDPANAGGKPTFNGNEATAKVTFTNLPANNTDFGKKNTSLFCDGQEIAKEDFEVFYTGTAKNHQDQANPTFPNWFVYYKQNEGGNDYSYDNQFGTSYTNPNTGFIGIADNSYTGGDTLITQINAQGRLELLGRTPFSKRYKYFYAVTVHERFHKNGQLPRASWGPPLDNDTDRLADTFEVQTSKTDPNDAISAARPLGLTIPDREVYAGGPVEEAALKAANTSQDWANPGENNKNK